MLQKLYASWYNEEDILGWRLGFQAQRGSAENSRISKSAFSSAV